MPSLEFNATVGLRQLRLAEVRGSILAELQRTARKIKSDFEYTVATWEDPATFQTENRFAGGDISVRVFTDNKIWGYLDQGTGERWAVMNNPFGPKTFQSELFSGIGQRTYNRAGYYTAIRGRQAMTLRGMQSMPGIEPRNWSVIEREDREDVFISDIQEAIAKGIRSAILKGKRF